MNRGTNEVEINKKGILTIDYQPAYDHTHQWDFDQGTVRETLSRILTPNTQYTFVSTTANPNAVSELEKYVVTRSSREAPWSKIRELGSDEDPRRFSSGDNKRLLRFNPDLLEVYNNTLGQLAIESFGEKYYVQYPLVKTRGVHNSDRPQEMIFWPTIHVIKDFDRMDNFTALLRKLNGEPTQAKIRQNEEPQNYRIPEVEQLKKIGLSPLIINPNSAWTCDGKNVVNALNFLTPFTLFYEFHNPTNPEDL